MNAIPLDAASQLYEIDAKDLQPMRGGHSTQVFSFQKDHRQYVMRLIPPGAGMDALAQSRLLDWMAYLAVNGACVPSPVPSRNKRFFEEISTGSGTWLAMVFTRAEGILSEELPIDRWDGPLFETLGQAIGKAHAIGRSYLPSAEYRLPDWEQGDNNFTLQIRNEPWLQERQDRLLEQVHALPKPEESYGPIHCDLHFGNFYVDVPRRLITLIDFDDSACGWFSMDIATLLFDLLVLKAGSDGVQTARSFLQDFLKGYRRENEMQGTWLQQLPLFMKLMEINLYDDVVKFYPDKLEEWGKKFMPGRKEHIEKDLPYVELDFTEL